MDRISKAGNLGLLALAGLVLCMPFELNAQVPIDEHGNPLPALEPAEVEPLDVGQSETLTDAELEDLVGPVALYPDDLLAIVLPASTYPLEIVQAARFLDELAKDSSLEPDESWDDSVVALLNYPEVVYMMDKEIDWTWRLGEAVITQQADLLAAVESFRERAYAAGNLESDERQTVTQDEGVIEIEPVDEEIIYVPYYEPEEVVVYQPRRVYHYYPYAYPVYYYPYPVGYSFASGYFWGVTTSFTIGWHNRYLHVHHPSYWGHRYYGRHYYGHYYRRPSISAFNHWYVSSSYRTSPYRYRDGDYWRPRIHRSGSRPETQSVRNYHYSGGDVDSGHSGRRGREGRQAPTRQHDNTRIATSGDTRTRQARTTNRQATTGNRIRTAVTDNSSSREARTGNRQRNRNVEDSVRANRATANNRQRPTADRQASVNRQARTSNRTASQQRPTQQAARTTRQANRQTVQRQATRPTVQRQAPARPAVQRQAPSQRQATRPAVQRQAPARSSRPAAAPARQVQRAAAPANRAQGRTRPRHKK